MEFEQPTDIQQTGTSFMAKPPVARFFPPAEVKLWSRENKDQEWKLIHTFRPPSLQKDAPTLLKQNGYTFFSQAGKAAQASGQAHRKLPSLAWGGPATKPGSWWMKW